MGVLREPLPSLGKAPFCLGINATAHASVKALGAGPVAVATLPTLLFDLVVVALRRATVLHVQVLGEQCLVGQHEPSIRQHRIDYQVLRHVPVHGLPVADAVMTLDYQVE